MKNFLRKIDKSDSISCFVTCGLVAIAAYQAPWWVTLLGILLLSVVVGYVDLEDEEDVLNVSFKEDREDA
jgi:hypothetical protein